MARKQRQPFEAAVTTSPLFKLASEIRIMIYELLLVQEGGMFITSDMFARRDYGRQGSTPYQCVLCGLTFLSKYGCRHHIDKHHSHKGLGSCQQLGALLPSVSVSLLQTCRIIRLEASPILYTKNAFHFSDPATASNFRWGTDCAQAMVVREMGINYGSIYKCVVQWAAYFTERESRLGQDFPHLRRITFNLNLLSKTSWFENVCSPDFRLMSEEFRKRSPGLELVHVLMLSNEKVLDCFEPLVDRKGDTNDGKNEVRRHVWANEKAFLRKDAVLWWGSQDDAVPQVCRLFGDQPQSQVSSEFTEEGPSTQPAAV